MQDTSMSVTEHLEELRKRLIVSAIGFAVSFGIGFFLAKPLIIYLQHIKAADHIQMNYFRVTDPFNIYMQMAFVIGIILVSPLLLYQLWAFVSPGLYKNERRVTLSYIPIMIVLFLAGVAFSFYVLFPYVLHFMGTLSSSLHITSVIGINEYFHFLIQITLPFGLVFELPVLVMFLTRLGIITPFFLTKIRKYAYFVLLVVAGLITPPDVMSQLIVMVPLVILYEISVLISRYTFNQSLKRMASHDES
ncbi:twin-arginine translocase subunit TatC [Pullulanibacillus sp. KACC 23026]|uniref:twin-arginine translocase subunit TatC n=1 Tax=Pullulanibacillus sp. KACC 23026 TaxID=3028315 RepID=UPI0023AE748D|nr:twin-arginine translocase subunit TatC [Pullulanibacillus sp. KACC 23026]WEG12504.1 twin-arginine translocase subunit TatC [Pullulanibacillus sp. KACC 23026]